MDEGTIREGRDGFAGPSERSGTGRWTLGKVRDE